jgi:glycosyltransferase involved in cell wall biosynthesis
MKKVAIIIPCYNEASNIATFVQSLLVLSESIRYVLTVIVVNDCSTDDTLLKVKDLDCVVLDLPINLGIGGAVQTGFRYAYLKGFDIAVQMDGDGQHPAQELPKVLAVFEQDPSVDVVIGSRFLTFEGFQSSALRRVGITYFTYLLRLLFGKTITDPTSGFRALDRKAQAIVHLYYPNEYPEPEILVHFFHKKLIVKEIQVEMSERLGGVSSISSWKSVYYMLKVTLGILFSHIRFIRYGKS